jgi:hypothetical protein
LPYSKEVVAGTIKEEVKSGAVVIEIRVREMQRS